jgi:Outer membrane lipoprotein carrier protein LolA-like
VGVPANLAGKIVALLAFACVSLGAGAARAACADPFALDVAYGAADFTQSRHLTGVRAPLVSRGRVEVAAQSVVWRVTEPLDIRTTITPAGITQAVEGGPPQSLGPQGGGDAFLSSAGLFDLLAGNLAGLHAHYDLAREPAAASGDWRVRLTPRAASMARFVSHIAIAGCERLENVEVRQASGDWMEIALSAMGS